jgi:hypothetical protein
MSKSSGKSSVAAARSVPLDTALPPESRALTLPWIIAFAFLLTLAACALWWPLNRIPVNDAINYNEGWNAYVQQTVANGGKIYGEAPTLSYTNYPPVSFYVVAFFGKFAQNVNFAGRWVSLLSYLAIVVLSGLTIQRISGDWRASAYAALSAAVLLAVYKQERIGMNDPHLLGMAFAALGLYLAVFDAESKAPLHASAVMFALSVFTKQTLLAYPAAVALYLFLYHRPRFLAWVITAAGASVALLAFTFVAGGSHFLEHLGLPRTYSLSYMVPPLASFLIVCGAGASIAVAWAATWPKEKDHRLVLWIFGLGTASGLVYLTGQGSDGNLLFDSVVGIALCFGCLAARLPEWSGALPRRNAFMAVALAAPFLACVVAIAGFWPLNVAQSESAARRHQEFDQLVQAVRAQPGPAMCENLLVCFEAGKPKVYDVYVAGNLLAAGKLREADILALLDQKKFGAIQLDRPGTNQPITVNSRPRFTPRMMTHIFSNYREALGVSDYAVYVPR